MKVEESELNGRLERFRDTCRKAGVKLTQQRLEIFREVASTLDHPDAEEVYRGVRDRVPTVSLDTVYRTLWMLHDLGLVSTLGPRGGSMRFDANGNPHHHYVCVRCGLVRDFESPALSDLEIPRGVGAFGSVLAARVEVRGLCRKCAKTRAAGRGSESFIRPASPIRDSR